MGKELDISSICSGQDPKSLYNGYIEYTQNQRNAFLLIVKYMKMCLDTLSKRGIIGNNIQKQVRRRNLMMYLEQKYLQQMKQSLKQ